MIEVVDPRKEVKMIFVTKLFGFFSLAALALAGCHEFGHVDGLGDYGSSSSDIVGEVQYVDTRAREIEIRTDSGRTSAVRYDNNTQVVYRQRNYALAYLVEINRDRDGLFLFRRSRSSRRRGGLIFLFIAFGCEW